MLKFHVPTLPIDVHCHLQNAVIDTYMWACYLLMTDCLYFIVLEYIAVNDCHDLISTLTLYYVTRLKHYHPVWNSPQ